MYDNQAIMKDLNHSPLFVAVSSDFFLRVYNYKNPEGPIKVLSGHKGMVASIIYIEVIFIFYKKNNQKYDKFISGSGDNTIKIWDAAICKYYCDVCSENNGFCF